MNSRQDSGGYISGGFAVLSLGGAYFASQMGILGGGIVNDGSQGREGE